ncbi:MAG TPA: molybdate ABC transporter substrate-binding protein [Burkholderiaceae bacterium]|nr:molybdate ABC transporter substrate-binding protein [Burkholderiaceae bacterium]
MFSSPRRSLAVLAGLLLSTHLAAAELTVSAAASLTNAFQEIASAFETQHPEHKVVLNFGASGALLQQIAKGAPADVFASADQETMDRAQQQSLIETDARRDFAANSLVLIVPAEGNKAPATLDELTRAPYERIAIGQPASVPVGRYTKAALEKQGLWPAIEARMIGAQNVRQVLDYVARAEVDAGFVYATDAALMADKVKVAMTVPVTTSVRYPIAPIAGSANAAAAKDFVAFVLSGPAQAVLAKYGFGKP